MKSDYKYERKQNGDRLIIRWYLNKHYIAKRCRFLCGIRISMTAPEEDFFFYQKRVCIFFDYYA